MRELPKRRYRIVSGMIDFWEETVVLDAEAVKKLRDGIAPTLFDWRRGEVPSAGGSAVPRLREDYGADKGQVGDSSHVLAIRRQSDRQQSHFRGNGALFPGAVNAGRCIPPIRPLPTRQ